MYSRNITSSLIEALSDSPVVLVHGARQTGKTTLVRELITKEHPRQYLTLDDASILSAAKADPAGFLAGLQSSVTIDEVQRAPELFPAIKAEVDRNRQPGRYLLTGSANVLLVPQLSESLAGRMEILPLCPLSQGEIEGRKENFIDAVFAQKLPNPTRRLGKETDLITRIVRGGYPEALSRNLAKRRRAWFGSYITTILRRDVRDLSNIEGLTIMPRLLDLLAARIGSLLNFSEFSRTLGMSNTTLKRYMALLEATFLVQPLGPWSSNLGKRLVKSSKLYLNDTGLAAYLLGFDMPRVATDIGAILENFVISELRKQIVWSDIGPKIFHFRTQSGSEVDIVLEDRRGKLVGIEVKASGTVSAGDFNGLRVLAEQTKKRFVRGIVLYNGDKIIPFGKQLCALPCSAMWRIIKP